MDEKEQDGDTHTRAHTMRVPFEVIDISVEKWAPSKLHMSRITESGRAWWSAVWSLILALTQCWAAVSSGRKRCLKTCRRSSTFSVRHDWSHFLACGGTQHTALLTKHFHDISINTATDHTHTQKRRKNREDSYGLELYWGNWLDKEEPVPYRCRVGAEASLFGVKAQADCYCRRVLGNLDF